MIFDCVVGAEIVERGILSSSSRLDFEAESGMSRLRCEEVLDAANSPSML